MKKYFKVSLAIFALLFLVLSCNDEPYEVHTHSFVSETYVLEDNKLYSALKCSCGEIQKGELVENGYIATPETAQEVLDSHNTGVIYFAEGEYQKLLEIRHSKKVSNAQKDGKDVEIVDLTEHDGGTYFYYRTIPNLTLVADEKAVFHKDFKVGTGHVVGTNANPSKDPVRNDRLIVDNNNGYYSFIDIDKISFINFNFLDGARLYFHYSSLDSHAKNIEINGCEFNGLEKEKYENSDQAIKFNADSSEAISYMFENVIIRDCLIKNYSDGIYTQSINNQSIINCNISNIGHNAIAVQSGEIPGAGKQLPFSGKVVIDNNTISNTSDRAIRFGEGKDAVITVSNNKISNAVDDGGEILKSQSLIDCSHTFDGNTYDGDEIVDKSTDSSLLWILKSKDVVEEK